MTKFFDRIADRVRNILRRQVTFRELMALDDRQLEDIGLTRGLIAEVSLTGTRNVVQVAPERPIRISNQNRIGRVA